MEPEISLLYSQAPATCPYPQPTPSSPHNLFPLPEDPSQYPPPIYVLVSPMVSFLQVSPPKPCAHLFDLDNVISVFNTHWYMCFVCNCVTGEKGLKSIPLQDITYSPKTLNTLRP